MSPGFIPANKNAAQASPTHRWDGQGAGPQRPKVNAQLSVNSYVVKERAMNTLASSTQDLAASITNRSKKADIVTGAIGQLNTREQIALLRPPRERQPMSRHKRHALESHSFLHRSFWKVINSIYSCFKSDTFRNRRDGQLANSDLDPSRNVPRTTGHRRFRSDLDVDSPGSFDEGNDNCDDKPQYTLKSVRRSSPSFLRRLMRCKCLVCGIPPEEYIETEAYKWDINAIISAYLSFSHRTSYFLLFLVFSLVYYVNILIFALVYFGFSMYYPECITSAGNDIGEGQNADVFGDSFMLSWTTFSTVG